MIGIALGLKLCSCANKSSRTDRRLLESRLLMSRRLDGVNGCRYTGRNDAQFGFEDSLIISRLDFLLDSCIDLRKSSFFFCAQLYLLDILHCTRGVYSTQLRRLLDGILGLKLGLSRVVNLNRRRLPFNTLRELELCPFLLRLPYRMLLLPCIKVCV